jgi:predicted DNA-binding antitoxin AbrB/MazE fold protein
MTIAAEGVYEGNGVLKLDRPVELAENARVRVLIEASVPVVAEGDDPTGWKAAEEFIGFIDEAPSDMAEKHDEYLYKIRRK